MENICYKCNSENIAYSYELEWEDSQMGKPYSCASCEASGVMWYDLSFAENFGDEN